MFACVALSREPWQLALSLLLIGFQLGQHRGDARRRSATSSRARRLGTIDRDLRRVGPDRVRGRAGPRRLSSSTGSAGRCRRCSGCRPACRSRPAALVWFGSREVRPEVVPAGPRARRWRSARVRGVLARSGRPADLRDLRRGVPRQPDEPAVPAADRRGDRAGRGRAWRRRSGSSPGPAALVGAVAAPLGGVLGDRIGFRPVLIGRARRRRARAAVAVPLAPTIAVLALAFLAFTACNGIVGAMVFSLLATEVPAGAPVGDAQPRLPAALRGGDHRPDRRRRSSAPVRAGRRRSCSAAAVFLVGARGRSSVFRGQARCASRQPPDRGSRSGSERDRPRAASRCRRTRAPAARASTPPGPSSARSVRAPQTTSATAIGRRIQSGTGTRRPRPALAGVADDDVDPVAPLRRAASRRRPRRSRPSRRGRSRASATPAGRRTTAARSRA